jgi:hypothetical protein
MATTHKLIKLRVETIQNLKRLKKVMGLSCLDELLNTMIRLTDEYRFIIKETGWYDPSRENKNGYD